MSSPPSSKGLRSVQRELQNCRKRKQLLLRASHTVDSQSIALFTTSLLRTRLVVLAVAKTTKGQFSPCLRVSVWVDACFQFR